MARKASSKPDSDTALRNSACLHSETKMQVVSEANDYFRKGDDVRWQPSRARQIAKGNPQAERGGVHQFGVLPKPGQRDSANTNPEGKTQVVSEAMDNNANFAWVQYFIHHLAPHGMVGFVLANGSMSSNQSGDCPARSASSKPKAKPQSLPRQRDIHRALIEADLVDCMVALPGQLFYSTQIPVCLWFLTKNKAADAKRGFRDRCKQPLFIDARKLGTLIGADMGNPSLN